MGSRFVPVKSEEELRRYHEVGLLYFNNSVSVPRDPEWHLETEGLDSLLRTYAAAHGQRDTRLAVPEDWGYLVEDDSPNEGDSPTNSE